MLHAKYIKIIFPVLALICSCTSIELPGKYISERNKIGPDAFSITLMSDSLFTFFGWSDILGEETIKGEWMLIKDTLFLSIKQSEKNQYIKINEGEDKKLAGVRIKVMDENGSEPLTGAEVYVNDNTSSFVMGVEGEILINSQYIDSLKIRYLEVDEFFRIKNHSANDFAIYINFKKIDIGVFYLNPKWLIKGKKLLPIDDDNSILKDEVFIKKN